MELIISIWTPSRDVTKLKNTSEEDDQNDKNQVNTGPGHSKQNEPTNTSTDNETDRSRVSLLEKLL